MKEGNEKIKSVFDLIFHFPVSKEQINSFAELQQVVLSVNTQLIKLSKTNIQDIQRYCYKNGKLNEPARLLRDQEVYEEAKNSNLLCHLIQMFHMMMTEHKMVQFLIKQNLPLSIYMIMIRSFSKYKYEMFKKPYIIECCQFILKFITISPSLFPRMLANMINSLLGDYSSKINEKNERYIDKKRDNEKQLIIILGLKLIKYNINLSSQAGVMVTLYRKAIDGQLTQTFISDLIEIIVLHFNQLQTRETILRTLDLGKAFAIFCNVDFKYKYAKNNEQKIEKCAHIIYCLLSSWSTLIYFLQEKYTLKNFVTSLKSKTSKEFFIINDRLISKIINQALKYDRIKMEKSSHLFGLSSNYLNYKALLLVSHLLQSTQMFEVYHSLDTKGDLLRNFGKIALKYFPSIFEKQKYNKIIVNSIRSSQLKQINQFTSFSLDVNSYFDECIIRYEFTHYQLIYFLLEVKEYFIQNEFEEQKLQSIQLLLQNIKKVHPNNSLLLYYYSTMIKFSEDIIWESKWLKLSKFLSSIIEHLNLQHLQDKTEISSQCLDGMQKIFQLQNPSYFRYLYITILDDAGKYFHDYERVQDIIFKYCDKKQYAFRIGKLLVSMDFEKEDSIGKNPKDLIQKLCKGNCSNELMFQIIQIIKRVCSESDKKGEWKKMLLQFIYNKNQQISCLGVEACEELFITNKMSKSLLQKVAFKQIKDLQLRKKMMYMLLDTEKGIQLINNIQSNFIKEECESWFKSGYILFKELSQFLDKETARYIKKRYSNFIHINIQNRSKLLCLPWNIKINQHYFEGFISHKNIKEKIKLYIFPELLIENVLEVSDPKIGNAQIFHDQVSKKIFPLTFKKEQIIKKFNKYKNIQDNSVQYSVLKRENIKLILKYCNNSYIVYEIIIDIPLSKDVYLPLFSPLNLFSQLCYTTTGMSIIRHQNIIKKCIEICENCKQINCKKGAIAILGMFIESKSTEPIEKIQILQSIMTIYEQTSSYQIKQICIWVLNVIVKDEECRRKMKEGKGWLILQSKYCNWMCYPHFYNEKYPVINFPIKRFNFMRQQIPIKYNTEEYKIIFVFLESDSEKESRVYKEKKKQMLQYFKKPEHQVEASNAKMLQNIFRYITIINFPLQKIKSTLDIFQDYIKSSQFAKDFPSGFA